MQSNTLGSLFARRFLGIAFVISLVCGFSASRLKSQTAEVLPGVKRVALDWPGTGKKSTGVRDRVVQKLRAGATLEIVGQATQVDAVLHGKAIIWVNGYISSSPRSSAGHRPIYRGFASMEVSGRDGKTLWSYLVTPRTLRWGNIQDDLADQLVREFLNALKGRVTGEGAAGASTSGPSSAAATGVALHGAGSTFSAPIYQKWFESFTHTRPDIQTQYASVGSSEGVQRLLAGQVDFGATDMPLSEDQLSLAKGRLLQIATTVGAVVPVYNVNGAPDGLNLSPDVLAGIFLGKIQRWNAPEIRTINRHAHLPDAVIEVIHRSDGSGTTFVWTDYLSKVSAEWKANLGAGTTVKWPVGRGAERNDGVAEAVHTTPNSIGYVEFLYALQYELNFAAVRNASGEFVKADLDSVTAAAKTVAVREQDGFGASITNVGGTHVYPIASLTWLLVPVDDNGAGKTAALRDLLRWILTSGQKQCEGLGYAPLPREFANRELQALAALH